MKKQEIIDLVNELLSERQLVTDCYKDGQVKIMYYLKDGKLDGEYKKWYRQIPVSEDYNYIDDEHKEWFENGQLQIHCYYNNRNYTCEICGVIKKKGLNVHHHDEEHYTVLQDDKFSVLCKSCHQEVERLLRRTKNIVDIEKYVSGMRRIYLASSKK